MGKGRKLILTVKEFNKQAGVTDYNINGIDNVKALYFVRYPQGQFEDLPKGDYEVIQDSNNQVLRIKNAELLNRAERFQIGYLFDFSSSKYEVSFGADVNILKDRYNELVDDVEELFKYVKENLMSADAQDVDTILPQLDTDEVWVKTSTGYRGLNIGNLEANIASLIAEFNAKTEEAFDKLLEVKDGYVEELKTVKDGQLEILNSYLDNNINRVTLEGEKQKQILVVAGTSIKNELKTEGDFQYSRVEEIINSTNIDSKLILMNQMFDVIIGSNRFLNGSYITGRENMFLDREVDGGILTTRQNQRSVYDGGELNIRNIGGTI